MDTLLAGTMQTLAVHEMVQVFAAQGLPLSAKLSEMLNEHFSHQTERRGCGYTQATRLLAEFINQPRSDVDFDDLKLFHEFNIRPLRDVQQQASLYGLELRSWRNLDINPAVQQFLQQHDTDLHNFTRLLVEQVAWQHRLRQLHQGLKCEESLLLTAIIQDIISPVQQADAALHDDLLNNLPDSLPVLGEKPKVGSCPMAEKFFLEIAHERTPRLGRVNVLTNACQQPVLLEKLNMGDDHSCISLVPLCLNGVRLPPGSSFSVAYNADHITKIPAAHLAGDVMPLEECYGFWFLRLTTLAVSPPNRQRAFTSHFRQQIDNDLFSPDVTTLSQLMQVAKAQMADLSRSNRQYTA